MRSIVKFIVAAQFLTLCGVLNVHQGYAAEPCASERKAQENAVKALTKAEDREARVAEKGVNRVERFNIMVINANSRIELANLLKDNCTNLGNIIRGILLGGKKFKFSSINACINQSNKMKAKGTAQKNAALAKKAFAQSKADTANQRAHERTVAALAAKNAADAALNQCLNPPPP